MAAVDFKGDLVSAVWALLLASATVRNYFKLANREDERTDGATRQRLLQRTPADFPFLRLELDDDTQGHSSTPTFGLAQAAAGCDAIVPVTVTLRISLGFESERLTDQTPQELAVRAALMVGYPKLSLPYVRSFTISTRREKDRKNANKKTIVMRIPVDMRLRLSQMR